MNQELTISSEALSQFELNPIVELKHFVSQYETARDMISKLEQRKWLYGGDDKKALGNIGYLKTFEQGKEEIKKQIKRVLKDYAQVFPIWHEWLVKIPGINVGLGGQFIVKLGYKFIPVMEPCPHCEGKGCERCKQTGEKKKAPPEFIIEPREFEYVSSVWHFLGQHTLYDEKLGMNRAFRRGDLAEDGLERQQGTGVNDQMRPILFQLQDQFVKHGGKYREAYLEFRKEVDRKHPAETCELCKRTKRSHKGHQYQMARRKTTKLWLSHWYTVDRTLKGLPVRKPYIIDVKGHTNHIKPFYFDREIQYVES